MEGVAAAGGGAVWVCGGVRWMCGRTRKRSLGVAFLLLWGAARVYRYYVHKKRRERWANAGQDVVIVHAFPKGRYTPNMSPFVLKLETYLRLAQITYQVDYEEPLGPKALCPWITLNGEEVADSQLIMERLGRQYDKNFESKLLTKEQQAVARAFSLMVSEHLAWCLRDWRYVTDYGQGIRQGMSHIPLYYYLLFPYLRRRMIKALKIQGVGRHTHSQVQHMVKQDLAALSHYLGEKPFLMGEEPCEVDCTVFGFLSQLLWNYPGSPYIIMLNNDFRNLQQYHRRLKDRLWPDWDSCLDPPRTS
ncbi:failed axon connections homolog [Homarus americanus]|uniref:Failed axon connections-like 2 n=1 Tax=Homarus americanus TaxID=6706 RepID=A0A8J5MJQ0_HOMAM|nr:failed axon connections homolog [Homarus americanus]KAG7153742.1 Failed axon connections-like 2 [Homarus americanus]